MVAYGSTSLSQSRQRKLGSYSVTTTLKSSEMLSTVGMASRSLCVKLAVPIFRHLGHRSVSVHCSSKRSYFRSACCLWSSTRSVVNLSKRSFLLMQLWNLMQTA
jgi:hypothetical protein